MRHRHPGHRFSRAGATGRRAHASGATRHQQAHRQHPASMGREAGWREHTLNRRSPVGLHPRRQLRRVYSRSLLRVDADLRLSSALLTRSADPGARLLAWTLRLGCWADDSAAARRPSTRPRRARRSTLGPALGRELRSEGIRTTTIAPAGVNTPFAAADGRFGDDDPANGPFMEPTNIAEAVIYTRRQPRRMRTELWTMWSLTEDH